MRIGVRTVFRFAISMGGRFSFSVAAPCGQTTNMLPGTANTGFRGRDSALRKWRCHRCPRRVLGKWRCHRRNRGVMTPTHVQFWRSRPLRHRTIYRGCSARFTGGDGGGSATCEERRPYQHADPSFPLLHPEIVKFANKSAQSDRFWPSFPRPKPYIAFEEKL